MKSPDVDRRGVLHTVDQALTLLEHLAGYPDPQTLTQLSRDLGTSKAQMHRLLSTLKQHDFVVQDELSRYGFGFACNQLAERSRLGLSAIELCLPVMRALWRASEETILLAIFQGDHAVVVEKLDSPRPVVARSALGSALPLHAVSTGKVLLASRPDREVERLLTRPLVRYTAATCCDPEKLWIELRKIRRFGYAVNHEGYREGVGGVAVPVRWSPTGRIAAALAICAPMQRFSRDFASLRDQVIASGVKATEALATRGGKPNDREEAA